MKKTGILLLSLTIGLCSCVLALESPQIGVHFGMSPIEYTYMDFSDTVVNLEISHIAPGDAAESITKTTLVSPILQDGTATLTYDAKLSEHTIMGIYLKINDVSGNIIEKRLYYHYPMAFTINGTFKGVQQFSSVPSESIKFKELETVHCKLQTSSPVYEKWLKSEIVPVVAASITLAESTEDAQKVDVQNDAQPVSNPTHRIRLLMEPWASGDSVLVAQGAGVESIDFEPFSIVDVYVSVAPDVLDGAYFKLNIDFGESNESVLKKISTIDVFTYEDKRRLVGVRNNGLNSLSILVPKN